MQVGGVAGGVELLAGPGPGGQVEGGLALGPDPVPVAVGQGGPAHAGPAAVLLRVEVRRLELLHGGREAADPGRPAGVGVGLARPATEPLDPAEPGRHGHAQADPGQRAGPVPLGDDPDLQPQPAGHRRPAVAGDDPEVGAGGRDPGPHHQRVVPDGDLVDPVLQAVQPDPPPQRLHGLAVVAAVVVGRRPPQVQQRPVHRQVADPHQPPGGGIEAP
jgi:hypothetical protein